MSGMISRLEAIKEAEQVVRYWSKQLLDSTTEEERDVCEHYLSVAMRRVEVLRQSRYWRP